jgi:hypothetical protein
MSYTTAGRNAIGTSGKGGVTHVGMCTDLAGTEVTGGTYARQAVTWGSMASGITTNTGAIAIPIPAGVTPVVVSYFDALSAGNRLGDFGYGSTGQLAKAIGTAAATGDLITAPAHGFTTDDRVICSGVNGAAVPAGLSATTLYFVKAAGLTTDVFAVALTSGGAAVDITANGSLMIQKTVPNTFASAGNANFAIGQLNIDLTEA